MARTADTAGTSESPPRPDAEVTRAQRDSAEFERARIRDHQRKLRGDNDTILQKLSPLEAQSRGVLEATRAESIARQRRDAQEIRLAMEGRRKLTRSATAMLRNEDGEEEGAHASEQRRIERWEARALREMFDIEPDSDSDGSALAEVFSAFDEADREQSPRGTDDSDYEEKPPPPSDTAADDAYEVQDDEEDREDEDEVESREDDDESEGDNEGDELRSAHQPKLHRNSHQKYDLRMKAAGPR
ncbi:hypothetical protein PF010_g6959 [Phytophthora fragariae]|uniref:Uncharacterized protein n=2 Tax=Phytophthora fragariae TaxID=53985 RepID=A0A6A3Z2L5_9STRA|nr:hypothetical protein PF003_g11346 [Phytophthora fragariae]KAE8932775.1 hypothetical protein PF009_g17195 [Phytophthora fragariae]KAE9121781.1 hypothetical protein PF010_g6959 [Phytophthora fragariae]KAE9218048.1 hypothetical protein PF004_g13983 [Phytophthora fragariae]KAE9227198.1 hypothetical protein PF002_g13885 [Phytophthora fragariae]